MAEPSTPPTEVPDSPPAPRHRLRRIALGVFVLVAGVAVGGLAALGLAGALDSKPPEPAIVVNDDSTPSQPADAQPADDLPARDPGFQPGFEPGSPHGHRPGPGPR